nr:hypothetical protein [Tanacetum cinerariifolium]
MYVNGSAFFGGEELLHSVTKRTVARMNKMTGRVILKNVSSVSVNMHTSSLVDEVLIHSIDDVAALFSVTLNSLKEIDHFTKDLESAPTVNDSLSGKVSPSDPIVQAVDINTKSTSYAGAAGASAKDQPKVNSNFRPLVFDPVFDGVNIYIPCKVVEKEQLGENGIKRIMMNTKGFFFFKFDSQAGLEAVLEGGPWLIRNSPIILKKWSMDTRMLKEELTRIPIWVKLHDGRSSFARCLVEVNSEADLVDVVTVGIPSLTGMVSPKKQSVLSMNGGNPCVIFIRYLVMFVTIALRKGKSKSNNGGQFFGPFVKQNVTYEPKATTSKPKKGATNVGNASKLSSMLKSTGTSSKKDNITMLNSYSALENEEE